SGQGDAGRRAIADPPGQAGDGRESPREGRALAASRPRGGLDRYRGGVQPGRLPSTGRPGVRGARPPGKAGERRRQTAKGKPAHSKRGRKPPRRSGSPLRNRRSLPRNRGRARGSVLAAPRPATQSRAPGDAQIARGILRKEGRKGKSRRAPASS